MQRSRVLASVIVLYLAAVAWITLDPAPPDTHRNAVVEWLIATCSGIPALRWVDYLVIEFTANIALFVPLGFLFTLLLGRWRWWLVLAIGVVATLSIEFSQLFIPSRFSDPRDLLANTLGTVIGIGIGAAIVGRRRGPRVPGRS